MPQRKQSADVREKAIALAAGGGNASAVARELGVHSTTVQRWLNTTDPAELQRYALEKRAVAQRVVLEETEDRLRELMRDIGRAGLDDKAAKAVQARATALGILDDHYGGRQAPGAGGRFGSSAQDLLNGWTERDRVTLERIERITFQPEAKTIVADPQG